MIAFVILDFISLGSKYKTIANENKIVVMIKPNVLSKTTYIIERKTIYANGP